MRRTALLALHVALLLAAVPAAAQLLLPEASPPAASGPPVWSADGTVDIQALEALLDEQVPDDPRMAEALRRLEQAPDAPRDAHYYWVWARLYLVFDLEKGIALLERAVAQHPRDVRLQALRMSYARRARCKECADDVIETLQKLAPDHPLTLRTMGLYQQLFFNDHESAVAYFERSIEGQAPGNLSWTYALLGESYAHLDRAADSARSWKIATELSPRSALFAAEYAVALTHAGSDFARAEGEARRALALRPNNERAQHALVYATYGRWAASNEASGDSAETQRLFAAASALERDLREVFTHACAFEGSTGIAIALLKAKKVDPAVVNEPDRNGRTCLYNVIARHDPKLVRVMIGLGGDIDAPDAQGHTPLMHAIAQDDRQTIDLLLELGADVNAVGANGSALSVMARNPNRSLATARRLLEAKADPNARDEHGYAPLHEAALRLDVELAELLLRHGADVDAATSGGNRPLGWAIGAIVPSAPASRRAQLVRLLVERGADAESMQGDAVSPLDYAREFQPEMVPLLER